MAELPATTATVADESVLKLADEIDFGCANTIGDLGVETLDSDGIRLLALDLAAVTFIDSSGLGALVRMHQAASAQGKRLALRNPPERVLKMLHRTTLDTVLQIETSGDALRGSGS